MRHNPLKKRFVNAGLLVLCFCGSLVMGQEASRVGMKKPRTLDDYQPRTLKEIVSLKPAPDDLRDKLDRLLTTRDIIPSRVKVVYAGSIRPISFAKKESIRQWARLYAGSMEHYTEPYQSEMLFVENGARYWLAVQTKSPLLKRKFRKGESLNLYLIRLGASISEDKYDWTLLVEDFRQANASKPAAEIGFVEMRFGKPPLINLSFDVVLRNDHSSPRWFLLPANLGSGRAAVGEKGGVDALEVFVPEGLGKVIIGRFLGTGGFNAILLPPRAEIRLRRFPISYWGDAPDGLKIEIVIAKDLKIGSDEAASWFGMNPLSSAAADIREGSESTMRIQKSKRTPDNKEVSPVIEVERRLTIGVSLAPHAPN